MKQILFSLFCCCFAFSQTQAQTTANSTFEKVTKIFDAKCSTSTCHGGSGHPLNLTGSLDEVYQNLLDVEAINPTAKEKGHKLISPGYPDRSFLFRKINSDLYKSASIDSKEGNSMPPNQALTEVEREVIREWILFGAPKEGIVDREELITEYYEEGGLPRLDPPPAPDPSEGFQIYFGTLFLAPQQEIEVHKKYDLLNEEIIKSGEIEIQMNDFSHHFAMYRYNEDIEDGKFPDGVRIIGGALDAYDYFLNTEFIATSQYPYRKFSLPEKTAFIWKEQTSLDINYHIKNYSTEFILPAEVYINIYYTEQESPREMFSIASLYGDLNPFILKIDNNAQDTTFVMEQFDENSEEKWDIWLLQAHTHDYGKDYDIFVRNPDGTKGKQLYEGFFDVDYNFNQGFFDTDHPPTLRFETLQCIDMKHGLIHEATYFNDTEAPVSFGLTTADEMFATYILYALHEDGESACTETQTTSITTTEISDYRLNIAPNPANNHTQLSYSLEKTAIVQLDIYNTLGQLVKRVVDQTQSQGTYQQHLEEALVTGVYMVRLTVDGEITAKKMIVL